MKYNYAVLGGTGHIGSALSQQLLKDQNSVLVIGHSIKNEKEWTDKGAGFETVVISDTEKLKRLFVQAK
jgi:UDP-glucose 4-epimerase